MIMGHCLRFLRLTLFISACFSVSVNGDLRCGSDTVLTQSAGEIISHAGFEFGHHYGKNFNCSWTIRSPFGQYVEVVAENFTVDGGFSSCYGDYLEVFDGPSIRSSSLGRFCGTTFNPITSTGNYLTLQFVTNSYSGYQGFKLFYNSTDHIIRSCPYGKFACDDGYCLLQSYKCDDDDDCGDDSDEMNCPVKTCSTNQFACRNHNCVPTYWMCDGDNDCGDNSDEQRSNCLRYTSTSTPYEYTTRGSSWHCGQLYYTGITGSIHSPHYPSAYDNNLFCRYHINAPSWTNNLSFAFNSNFSIESDSICSYDSVRVYSDNHTFSHGPFCGSTAPASFVIQRNRATVEFSSDGSVHYTGFELTWSAT